MLYKCHFAFQKPDIKYLGILLFKLEINIRFSWIEATKKSRETKREKIDAKTIALFLTLKPRVR